MFINACLFYPLKKALRYVEVKTVGVRILTFLEIQNINQCIDGRGNMGSGKRVY
jgi:hypothetical protein